jgi:hypothetical protein
MSIDIVALLWHNQVRWTESGVGGEARKGLQPEGSFSLLALGFSFVFKAALTFAGRSVPGRIG